MTSPSLINSWDVNNANFGSGLVSFSRPRENSHGPRLLPELALLLVENKAVPIDRSQIEEILTTDPEALKRKRVRWWIYKNSNGRCGY